MPSLRPTGSESPNERQRAYLLAIFTVDHIFTVDQELETEIRNLPYHPFQSRPKASEWRWLEYSEPVPEIQKPASRLLVVLGDDELAVCRDCYEAAAHFGRLSGGRPLLFDMELRP